MTWTTQKPTKPGWYWYRELEVGPKIRFPRIREMTYANGVLMSYSGMTHPSIVANTEGEWAGPIPEPTERDEREEQP